MNNNEHNRQTTPLHDALDSEQHNFNLSQGRPASLSTKQTMQLLYRQQLDSFLQEKEKLKQLARLQLDNDRREFNERAQQSKEAEKMKDLSYKNYYNMLMNNQAHNQETYISPFSKRDAMKDNLINNGLEAERKRNQLLELQMRKKEQERKQQYKNELLGQIEDKRKKNYIIKHEDLQEKEIFQKNSKGPEEISRYERERKKEEHERYREDLDKVRQFRSQSQSETGLNKIPEGFHNILTNPLPYNIQNPYILKEMGMPKNHSYLAMKGEENLKL